MYKRFRIARGTRADHRRDSSKTIFEGCSRFSRGCRPAATDERDRQAAANRERILKKFHGMQYAGFGNISKSGTISFQPTYSYLTNRMTQIGSSTPTYDGNGNALNDTAHTYSWDMYGKPVSIDGVTLTYDGLGRMVEQNRNGSYTEIDYAPTGAKLQILQGQSAIKDFTALPGGAVAVYLASVGGLAYYRHSDWLGSSRLASTPSRTIYYDGAYAPFGENYAQTGTTDLSFTGMNQDTVSNLFDFPAREYNGIHGRWPSPDPAGISSIHPQDPQSLNRYAYVRNSPLGFIDPNGMDDCSATFGTCNGKGGAEGSNDGEGGGSCDPAVESDCGNGTGSTGSPDPGSPDPCTGNPGLCDPGDPCSNPYAGACSDPFGGSGPMGWGNGNIGGPHETGGSGDPCAYLNDTGTGVESVDNNSSPGECSSTGGVWIPNGGGISLAQDGTNTTVYSADQWRLHQASRAGLRTMFLGQVGGTAIGCGVGALIAGGATAATDTYPLAGATIPGGCIEEG